MRESGDAFFVSPKNSMWPNFSLLSDWVSLIDHVVKFLAIFHLAEANGRNS